MYSTIMIPVDLKHTDQMDKALNVAADLAKLYNATAHIVGITPSAPTEIAHNPREFGEKLAAYGKERSAAVGIDFATHAEISHDIRRDLDDVLARVAKAIDADLVVMASHVPGFADHILASNAGYLASHSTLSVFVVR